MNVLIKRISSRNDGMFGVLFVNGLPIALTLERPWEDNRKGESCIPSGKYRCRRVQSPKFGNTFEVTQVQGRTAILFHKGNLMDDSHGCILVGEKFSVWEDGACSISSSADGFNEFLSAVEHHSGFDLVIEEYL